MPQSKNSDTEVVAASEHDRRQRRRFSAEHKERILREADACEGRGATGELLRREGIYSSHVSVWRAQREHEGRVGLEAKRPGPRPSKDAKDRLIEQQNSRFAKLEKELRISKALIELQEKAHEILGIALPRIDDNSEDVSPSSSNSALIAVTTCFLIGLLVAAGLDASLRTALAIGPRFR